MKDGPRLQGASLVVTVERHSTGEQSILELCEFADGYRWMQAGDVITDLEPRPTTNQARTYLEEVLGDDYLIHWPRKRAGKGWIPANLRTRWRRVAVDIDTALAHELSFLAQLHGWSLGEVIRRITLDYMRPGPAPLPALTKDYIQSLLEQHRAGNLTMPATHRRPKT